MNLKYYQQWLFLLPKGRSNKVNSYQYAYVFIPLLGFCTIRTKEQQNGILCKIPIIHAQETCENLKKFKTVKSACQRLYKIRPTNPKFYEFQDSTDEP